MMRPAKRASRWLAEAEKTLSCYTAELLVEPVELLTAEVDDRLRTWAGEGPVDRHLQAAIAGEHDALVVREAVLARAEDRSLGWLVKWLRLRLQRDPSGAVLPPASYRAMRLGQPDPGGTWHRATVSRIFHRLDLYGRLAVTRRALAQTVREAVLPELYSCGLDRAAARLNRMGVPSERQTTRALIGLGDGAGRWSGKRLKAFLVATSPAGPQAREPARHQAAIWQRHIAAPWSDEARPADIAEALNAAALLTPAQQRGLYQGRCLSGARWSAATVRGLARRLGKHRAWSAEARDAHRAACRARIGPLCAAGLSGRNRRGAERGRGAHAVAAAREGVGARAARGPLELRLRPSPRRLTPANTAG